MLATWPAAKGITSPPLCKDELREEQLLSSLSTTQQSYATDTAISTAVNRPYFSFVSKIRPVPKDDTIKQPGFL
jgi:hypothetical protein